MSDTQNTPEPLKDKAIHTLEDDVAAILHGEVGAAHLKPSSDTARDSHSPPRSGTATGVPSTAVLTPSRPPLGRPLTPPPRITFPTSAPPSPPPKPPSAIEKPNVAPNAGPVLPSSYAVRGLGTSQSNPGTVSRIPSRPHEAAVRVSGIVLPPPPPQADLGESASIPTMEAATRTIPTRPPAPLAPLKKSASSAFTPQALTGGVSRPAWGEVQLPQQEASKSHPVFITPPPPPQEENQSVAAAAGSALGASFSPPPLSSKSPVPTSTSIFSVPKPQAASAETVPSPLTSPFPKGGEPTDAQSKSKHIPAISPIRTLTSDIAEVIETNKTSLASIALAENEQKIARGEELIEASSTRKNLLLIFASVILVLAGFGAGYALIFLKKPEEKIVVSGRPQPFLRSELSSEVSAFLKSPDALLRDLSADLKSDLPAGSLKEVAVLSSPTPKTVLSLGELFEKLESGAPPELVRSFKKEYFLGAYGFRGSRPLLIARVGSFDVGYGGMLAWEKDMLLFFESLFSIRKSTLVLVDGPNSRFGEYFEDGVVKNKDVRYVRDSLGETLLVYSFIDNTTLVITTDEYVLGALIERLNSARLTR